MSRDAVAVVVLASVLAAGVACSEDGESAAAGCPTGSTRREAINEVAGPGAPTRDDAVRAELENLEMSATDDAIATGVVAAVPGGNVGTELVKIETENGTEVTMTLAPLDPGWAVESSSWCAPDDG